MIIQVDAKARVNLATNLASMQEAGELCDFAVIVGESKILAHKCILAASCEYFRTSFRFSQSSEASSSIDLSHLGCSMSVVKNIIQSFYKNEIELEESSVEAVLRLVDYFMCEDLRLCVEVFMDKTLGFHSAVLYFQLALQYRLNSTSLFRNAQCYLWFRFHDYFLYHPDTLDSSVDVLRAFQQYRLFHFCSPLQVLDFMLRNLSHALSTVQHYDAEEASKECCIERITQTFEIISSVFDNMERAAIKKWTPYLLRFVRKWMMKGKMLKAFGSLKNHVHDLKEKLVTEALGESESSRSVEESKIGEVLEIQSEEMSENSSNGNAENTNLDLSGPRVLSRPSLGSANCDAPDNSNGLLCSAANFSASSTASETVTTQMTPACRLWKVNGRDALRSNGFECAPELRNPESSVPFVADALSVVTSPTPDSATALTSPMSPKDVLERHMSEILVVLAPSAEMSSQVNVVDAGKSWPLVSSPQLELALYDVELKTWRCSGRLEFPLPGAMLEKHMWRLAFFNNCVYLFSLVKATGIEYDLTTKKWTFLKCSELFAPHNEDSPVKSVIPIAVGSKLIVLSMSRSPRTDGSYWTQQNFHEFNFQTKTFTHSAMVRDERIDLPVTQWTVHGNTLITVKASTMMYRHLSRIQYIHVFDADTSSVKTHNVVCAMESGIKVLMKGSVVYLLDKEGWCRSYDLGSSEWTGLTRYPTQTQTSFTSPYTQESVYPALTRVTCHAGSSRWEVTTSPSNCSAYMQEVLVADDGSIATEHHAPPPFQFVTGLCPGMMARSMLDQLSQAQFEYCESKNC
ncbi:uncharacterized protein LOC101852911 [Aplysia californica]|uniref:Uncharacterized protein LOC101852911 n=1 Tax=Aplysia californica TaxID=6500 RepID=A0ABM0JIJ2_APLCA|nr:uncharacterized protein LOC101852911 [Aplysia californica]